MIHYVCKYTPLELFKGFGEECAVLEEMPENFELSDQIAHANLCGFGKSVIQAVLEGKVEQLVLVNCCDSMRRVYDIVESTGKCKFLYMLDMPHEDNDCEKVKLAQGIHRLKKAYGKNLDISPTSPHAVTDYFLERGDYFKLEQLTFGYTLKTPNLRFMDGLRIYGSVNNVFTLTKFSGVDPSTYNVNGLTPGASGDRGYYPSSRQFILGMQIDF